MGVLDSVRVLDMTRVLAGPWSTQMLADLGADVVKVEHPQRGDDTRHWGPPFAHTSDGEPTTESAYFLAANRNKRSVAIDFSTESGLHTLRELIAKCDVLVENYKVGDLAKHGLDYTTLGRIHPRLVYCSITGFGQNGPYAARAGYDFIVQGLGGFMSITGEADGQPGGGPQKAGVAVADLFAGAHATIGILAALAHRDRTGEGQHVDVSLLDVQVAMMANMATNYLASGKAPHRWGNAHPNIVPYQTFRASDGWIIVAAGNDGQFRRFVGIGGYGHLADDPAFATNPARVRHRSELVPQLEAMTASHPAAWWIEQLDLAGVPCGPINDLADVFQDPQVLARGMLQSLPHPTAGHVRVPGSAIKLSRTPVSYRRPPPLLGEHTEDVLLDWCAGYPR